MKILVDMNLSPGWIDYLVEAEFEAVHWSQVGAGNAHDSDVMKWAASHDHVVLTSDLDFGAILAATQNRRPSVLQLRSDILTPQAIGPAVLVAIRQTHRELSEGAIVSIDAARARLRLLPLRM
jgi:predicted nuclease of predicted toxin-antitoxin system